MKKVFKIFMIFITMAMLNSYIIDMLANGPGEGLKSEGTEFSSPNSPRPHKRKLSPSPKRSRKKKEK